jgi:Domain of unknown function (DUF397)
VVNETPEFRTSARCSTGHCVEWSPLSDGGVVLRSGRRPGESITLTSEEWRLFLSDIREGMIP